MVVVVVVVGGRELFVLILLLQGLLPFLKDGGDLPLHEGPGHIGAGQRTSVTTGAEDLGVAALLLDGVRRAGETELVMANCGTLKWWSSVSVTLLEIISSLPERSECPLISVHRDCTSKKDY